MTLLLMSLELGRVCTADNEDIQFHDIWVEKCPTVRYSGLH